MSTRTYERQTITWDIDDVLALVEAGQAKAFPSPAGTNYVVKTDGGSFAIRPSQIVELPKLDLPDPEDLAYLRSVIVDHDSDVDYRYELLRKAEAAGVSVDEYTDGEYIVLDGVPVLRELQEEPREVTLAAIRREEDALLAKFGL